MSLRNCSIFEFAIVSAGSHCDLHYEELLDVIIAREVLQAWPSFRIIFIKKRVVSKAINGYSATIKRRSPFTTVTQYQEEYYHKTGKCIWGMGRYVHVDVKQISDTYTCII